MKEKGEKNLNKNFFFPSTLINSLFYVGVKRGETMRKGSQEWAGKIHGKLVTSNIKCIILKPTSV